MKKFYEIIESLCISIIFITTAILFLCRVIVVDGDSMTNTLQSGEKIITTNFIYSAEKGDIVVTDGSVYHNRPLIKRVIATGGDVLKIDYSTGDVYLNGQILQENYILEKISPEKSTDNIEITLPEGYVFLMGDNRNGSLDSRDLGIVNEQHILGKAVFRISPLSRIGKVN